MQKNLMLFTICCIALLPQTVKSGQEHCAFLQKLFMYTCTETINSNTPQKFIGQLPQFYDPTLHQSSIAQCTYKEMQQCGRKGAIEDMIIHANGSFTLILQPKNGKSSKSNGSDTFSI